MPSKDSDLLGDELCLTNLCGQPGGSLYPQLPFKLRAKSLTREDVKADRSLPMAHMPLGFVELQMILQKRLKLYGYTRGSSCSKYH